MNAALIIHKFWNFCTTLRDDSFSYGDYLEQLKCNYFEQMKGCSPRIHRTDGPGISGSPCLQH